MTDPAPSEGAARLLEDWLDRMRGVRGASPRTITAYRRDVSGFLGFLALHHGGPAGRRALAEITTSDMRAWMARERGRGLSARSLARALSAVKSFYAWLADAHGVEAAAVTATRGPKQKARLPRPVDADAARALIGTVEAQSLEPWIAARDVAVVTLLYGCGLRISEALGLTWSDAPLPETLRITGKGGRERIVPVLPVACRAVEAYRDLCPFEPGPARRSFSARAAVRSIPATSRRRCRPPGCSSAFPPPPRPTRYAIPSPRICSKPAAICAPSRNCSATPRSPRPRSTPASIRPA